MYCVLARSSRSWAGAGAGGGGGGAAGGGASIAGIAVVRNDAAEGVGADGAAKSVSGIVNAGLEDAVAIISRSCAADTATVASGLSSGTGGDGRAGGGGGGGAGGGAAGRGGVAGCGAVTDSESFRLGDGVFLRMASVSISSPVVKTS